MLDPTKIKYPMSKVKGENPSKIVGGAKLHLESNPIPTRDARGLKQNIVHSRRPHRD